ncbi:27574_t:CDS:2, partial [Gigaspora margarita]
LLEKWFIKELDLHTLCFDQNILYSQKEQISEVDHRPKGTKYLYTFYALQNGDYRDNNVANPIMGKKPSNKAHNLPRQHSFANNEAKSSKAKSQQPKEGMYRNLEKIFTAHKRISYGHRKTLSHYRSSFFSQTKNTIITKRQKFSLKKSRIEFPSDLVIAKY